MNILLVNNIASLHSHLATSLNKIEGVNAKYIVFGHHQYINKNQNEIFLDKYPSRKNPFTYLYHKLTLKYQIKKLIEWCDVVYYIWDSILDEYDLELAHKLNKKIYVEWVGSDIRDPEILFKINPYYKDVFEKGYNYAELERSNFKNIVQEKFAKYNASLISTHEMLLYIKENLFIDKHVIFTRLNVKDFKISIPSSQYKTPLIIHSPSAPIVKGSDYIIKAIEELKTKYHFDFELITNKPREEVLSLMQKADIFIDQIICGGYGLASVEAMSFGKPVLCYILPQLFEHGLPKECPIVNANPDNIKEKLEELIVNPALRKEIGEKSRKYVEDFHDSDKIALQLIEIFKKKDE
jgi:glycosyltransferase involved in cell wall biosynthesis